MNTGNYSSLSNKKNANLCQNAQNTLLLCDPRPPSRNEGPILLRKERGEYGKKGRGRAEKKKEEGTGLTYKAMEGRGDGLLLRGHKGEERRRKGGGIHPKVKVSRIKTLCRQT